MNNKKIHKTRNGLRDVKKTFLKDSDLEPSLKYEISKEIKPKSNKKN